MPGPRPSTRSRQWRRSRSASTAVCCASPCLQLWLPVHSPRLPAHDTLGGGHRISRGCSARESYPARRVVRQRSAATDAPDCYFDELPLDPAPPPLFLLEALLALPDG